MANDTPEPDATPTGPVEASGQGGEPNPWARPAGYRPEDRPAEEREGVTPSGPPTPAAQPPFGAHPGGPGGFWPGQAPGSFGPGDRPGPFPTTPVPAYGWPPRDFRPAPAPPRGRRTIAGAALVALVAAVVGGGVGGAVGYSFADRSGSAGVLSAPLPEVDEAAAPLTAVEAVAERVLPSVVQLRVTGPGSAGEGSGMVLSADGLLLTNNHVVEPAADGGSVVAVFQDGSTTPARIIGRDPTSDLAVLRAQGVSGLTPIELGNSDAVRVGQQVVAIGSPLGLGGSVTTGIISALDRAVSVGGEPGGGDATVLNALQTDAAINPGNSGGPLVDMQGRVVGINSAIATTGAQGGSIGVGFSIPINQARRTAQELEATGRATRAVLGVQVAVGARELDGAVLGPVTPGGPADRAGLREGQVVTRVDDRIISGGDELVAAIRENAPGDRVTLVVDGQEVQVTLASETG
ncbi:S1C family serine protease [Pseudonocardia nigra]|uniref:S1C family serine protease n=1 Tax=Pseudonocardia nigra TaxID=1921578 RepID=UPI001C5DE0CC|nr:trypsin-like peptidase domain-containing protein [Pseudonocardia nigra]